MSDINVQLKANRAFVLIGAPGSGKGTQADEICKFFNMHHVATGDLFRDHLKRGTELGKLARSFIDRGELVPDHVTDGMLKDRLQQGDNCIGFVLDGFPRTLPQAAALTQIIKDLDLNLRSVLYINVSDERIISRLGGRLICRHCQTPYHRQAKPPKTPNLCDICGDELFQRSDDNPETVKARLHTFHQQTEPLIEHYKQQGLLKEIPGDTDMQNVTRTLVHIVADLIC